MPSDSGDDRRRATRYMLNVPFQLNGTGYNDIELIDISETGMQIKSTDFDIFKGRGYQKNRKERLKISVIARLAWAEPDEDGGFLTGWAFEMEDADLEGEPNGQALA